ncbi:hypothetical protein KUTeg_014001 [Tegillarca granosa]|uniref:Cytochrome b5 heme-binding domain-containing protein n=1 Tax=Tegillarca granosa TaxID=220873 RepID=A0ABQ9EVB9_TEGGR|nr:hypothetical protein KUTeg_014001 [Tegillarca granosa]
MKTEIFLVLLFFIINSVSVLCYEQVKVTIEPDADGKPRKIFTAEELKEYDGSKPNKPIYMGVRGVVFDVTKGKDFYGPGAAYSALAGKDASRAIALWSLEEKDMHHDLSGLPGDTLKGLDDVFKGTYMSKYPIVGYMDYLKDLQTKQEL